MKLGILAGNVCRVCGSDTMGTPIGCSCKKMMKQASFIILAQNKEAAIEYNYSIKMRKYLEYFMADYEEKVERHEGKIEKMYRTEFNRKFYPSLYAFVKEKGYCSKKQLDIVIKRFCSNFDLVAKIEKEIEEEKEKFLQHFEDEHFELRLEVARNLWKQKNKK